MALNFYYYNNSESLDQYFKEIANIPVLSEKDEKALGVEAKKGSLEARDTLVNSFLKYVVSVARNYQDRGVALEDLVSEGNIGLLYAVEGFDPNEGRLSTYASYWIKKAIIDAIREKTGITHVEIPTDRFENYRIQIKGKLNSVRRIKSDKEIEPFVWMDELLSLDTPVSDDEGSASMVDFLADENQNPEDIFIKDSLQENVRKVLRDLSEWEQVYITCYFGLDGHKQMTIKEISDAYKMPEGKVNRTIMNALRTLRTNEKVKALRGYVAE